MWSGLSAIHASVFQAMSCANLTNVLLSGKDDHHITKSGLRETSEKRNTPIFL